jgi:hypothetical protein
MIEEDGYADAVLPTANASSRIVPTTFPHLASNNNKS